jgi:nucleoside-diphosphate-sugar epimerase
VETVWRAAASTVEPPLTRYRASLMRRDVHFSIASARRDLGYRPELSWQEGMARSVAQDPYLREQGEP